MTKNLIHLKEKSIAFFESLGFSNSWSHIIQSIIAIIIILILAWVADRFSTFLMRKLIPKIIGKTKNKWDDILLKNRIFSKTSHFLPGIVVLLLYPLISSAEIRTFIEYTIESYFIIVFLLVGNAFINAFNDIYSNIKGEDNNIKIYLQLTKVILFSLGGIAIIAIFANKAFMDILKGLGAMVTILLIVYKDTISGFVSGIQLSANKMVKVGDWIVLPDDHADGVVQEITLNTVKVQNWDKTITTVPTYKLTSNSFTNWKGMTESGGRRIKRNISIDMDFIHFLSEKEIEYLKKFNLLKDYIEEKLAEISNANASEKEIVNQRKLTNIGTFRIYIEEYLKNSGLANLNMTFIVRQLQPTETGVPIEIYMFSKQKEWAIYEKIQSDIFDHILAILPEFNLKVFQRPSSTSLNISELKNEK